jgi:hypothetical protein
MTGRIPDPMPFIFESGDLGEFEMVPVTTTSGGAPVYERRMVKQPKYTGGKNADGSWTLAKGWENYRPHEVEP